MPGVITRGDFGKFLWPGINAAYGAEYDRHPIQYTDIFDSFTSQKSYEEDVGITGLGLVPEKAENEAVTYDSMTQGFVKRYTMVSYASGFIISWEMYSDSQYAITNQMLRRPRALAFSARQTMETLGANVLNRAFNGNYTGADGLEMCSDVHLNAGGWGGTHRNELATASDLNDAALRQALIDIRRWEDDRGLKISVMGEKLIVPPELDDEADILLNSTLRSGTSDNDKNVYRGRLPGGHIVNNYLTDPDAWFIKTNCPDGMKYFSRQDPAFDRDNDFDTKNAKFMVYFRCAFGWTDPRGVYGSPGK